MSPPFLALCAKVDRDTDKFVACQRGTIATRAGVVKLRQTHRL